jgi:hypothetical protein
MPGGGRLRRALSTTSAYLGGSVAAACAVAAHFVPDGVGDVVLGAAGVAVLGGAVGAVIQSEPAPGPRPLRPLGTYHYLCPWRVADLHAQLFYGANIQQVVRTGRRTGTTAGATIRVARSEAAIGRTFDTSQEYESAFDLSLVNQLQEAREALSDRGLLHDLDDDTDLRWYTPPTRESSNEFVKLTAAGADIHSAFESHPAETCDKETCIRRSRECTVEVSVPVGPQGTDDTGAQSWTTTIQLGAWGRSKIDYDGIRDMQKVTVLAVVRVVDRDARSLTVRALAVFS